MPYYFGYGSNMKQSFFKKRCSSAEFIETAKLRNAKFVYDGISKTWDNKPAANVISSENDYVWGAVYKINESDLESLKHYEGFPDKYGKGRVRIMGEGGDNYNAWIFFRIGQKSGEPSNKYRNKVLDGARECGISDDYIEKYIM